MGRKAHAGRRPREAQAVAQVVYSPRAAEQFQRAIDALRDTQQKSAVAASIRSAVDALGAHPFVGRRLEDDLRELVISYGTTGFIALYRFVVHSGEVRVLALKHQREIGYLP